MATIINKTIYKDARDLLNLEDDRGLLKRLQIEEQVANVLEQIDDESLIIICHPIINKYIPEFLLYSPDFGFKIISLKYINLEHVLGICMNGLIEYQDHRVSKPYDHVRLIKRELDQILEESIESNHRISVGMVVGFPDLQKDLIECNFLKNWSYKTKNLFYHHHFFESDFLLPNVVKEKLYCSDKDESVTKEIHEKLLNFMSSIELSNEFIMSRDLKEYKHNEKIIRDEIAQIDQEYAKNKKDIQKINECLNNEKRKLVSITDQKDKFNVCKSYINFYEVEQMKLNNHIEDLDREKDYLLSMMTGNQSYNTAVGFRTVKFTTVVSILCIMFILFSSFIIYNRGKVNQQELTNTISSIKTNDSDSLVKVKATVQAIEHDFDGIESYIINDKTDSIDAVIDHKSETIFLEKGKEYSLRGYITNDYGNEQFVVVQVNQ